MPGYPIDPDVDPIDPDVDLHDPAMRAETVPSPIPVLAAISAGGVLGALSRYALLTAWPHTLTGFPWAAWTINVTGSFLIGVLMAILGRTQPHRLVRPFLGVGVLGGYTTFSTSVVDVQHAAAHGAAGTALLYLGATVVGALLAVTAGSQLAGAR